ncbi:MAG: response regulator transcription factor [Deinococcota bacterium]|nr:response regulator transcription factor [Deinococcota bacterium]
MTTNTQVLVVEDEGAVRELLAFHLRQAGFGVVEAATAGEAWDALPRAALVVLDWMLPDESGVEWLKRLRAEPRYSGLPVLMLTARATEVDKVQGLGAGADDYLVKPFSTAELVARLKALLRRTKGASWLEVDDLKVDTTQGRVDLGERRLQLTRREFELVAFLAAHPGRVFSRSELLDRVWGEDFLGTERTVDQHVAQLRALLGPERIETVRGRGYRLQPSRHER